MYRTAAFNYRNNNPLRFHNNSDGAVAGGSPIFCGLKL